MATTYKSIKVRNKAEALRKAGEKYLFYFNLCHKCFKIHMDTLAFEGIDLLHTCDKYNRIVDKATEKRDYWEAEVQRILHG